MTSQTSIGGSSSTVSKQLLDTMNGTGSATSATSASSGTSASSLQTTFLQLLITQLQNQDPTNPMDSSQMTSQLAQIDTVTGINQLNTSLTSLSTQLNATQEASSSSLIGATVLAPGNSLAVTSGQAVAFGVSLAAPASDLQIQVTNSAGQIVNTVDLGPQAAGTVPEVWSPVDASGSPLPTGTYTISATGTVGGKAATATTLTPAVVEAIVQQAGGGAGAVLSNNNTVALTSIGAILSPGGTASSGSSGSSGSSDPTGSSGSSSSSSSSGS